MIIETKDKSTLHDLAVALGEWDRYKIDVLVHPAWANNERVLESDLRVRNNPLLQGLIKSAMAITGKFQLFVTVGDYRISCIIWNIGCGQSPLIEAYQLAGGEQIFEDGGPARFATVAECVRAINGIWNLLDA